MIKKIFFFIVLALSCSYLQSSTYTVDDAGDTNTPTTLRFAINQANADPGSTIEFNIAPGGVQTITLLSELPEITASGTVVNGFTQPGWSADDPQIVLDCNGFNGILINGTSDCTIQGLVINNSGNFGLEIRSTAGPTTNTAIYGCFFGTDQTGTASVPNFFGIGCIPGVSNVSGITIGGILSGQGNIISGSSVFGIIISSGAPSVTNVSIANNRIGTDKAGTGALSNDSGIGLATTHVSSVTIGGPTSAYRNIISGNSTGGIFIQQTSNVALQNNYIGTTITGAATLANGNGISVDIHGGVDISDNLISGNILNGILVTTSSNNTNILTNFIGTNAAGTGALPNQNGIQATNSSNIFITPNNLISGNSINGILFDTVSDSQIKNNSIGTNVTGTAALANQQGIQMTDCNGITIENNLISGNSINGILANSSGALVLDNNFIGTNAAGTAALPNQNGINLNTIDTTDISSNLISGNSVDGIVIISGTTINIDSNQIGTNSTGTAALANQNGIDLTTVDTTNISSNLISGNSIDGIFIDTSTTVSIDANIIGLNSAGTGALPNQIGIEATGSDTLAFTDNIISANSQYGIFFDAVTDSILQGNFIGTDPTGVFAFGNGAQGIFLSSSSSDNIIGGDALGEPNIINFNGSEGILIDTLSNNNQIIKNTISSNGAAGVLVQGASILNPILRDSIFGNTLSGIILLTGGNHEQIPPTIVSAVDVVGADNSITVTAQAPILPLASTFRLEFFINEVNTNPITEGEIFLGAIDDVPTGAQVTATFTIALPSRVGQFISATATNLNNVGNTPGDTSPFTENTPINPPPTPTSEKMSLIVRAILQKYPCVI